MVKTKAELAAIPVNLRVAWLEAMARARRCEHLAVRLDQSGEPHSAEVARMLAAGHRRTLGGLA